MTHKARTIMLGLVMAWLAGYFTYWAAGYDLFRPVSGLAGMVVILILTRWFVGRND